MLFLRKASISKLNLLFNAKSSAKRGVGNFTVQSVADVTFISLIKMKNHLKQKS